MRNRTFEGRHERTSGRGRHRYASSKQNHTRVLKALGQSMELIIEKKEERVAVVVNIQRHDICLASTEYILRIQKKSLPFSRSR